MQHLVDDEIDLRQLWRTLMRNKWGIFGFAFVVTVLTTLVVFSMRPVYQATATLMFEGKKANVVSIEQVYGLDSSGSEYLLTQLEILKSRNIAEKVVTKLALQEHPEFNQEPAFSFNWRDMLPFSLPGNNTPKELSEQDKLNRFVEEFQSRLKINPVGKTLLVQISFQANSPQLAADVANAMGQTYIESNLDAKLEVTVQASTWLSERLEGIQAGKKAAEQELQNFLDTENLVGDEGGATIANKQLDLVANKLIEARGDRLELENLYRQIQGAKGSIAQYELVPGVLQDPTVQDYKRKLLEIELKSSELAKRYGPKHPTLIGVQSELNRVRSSLDKQILSVINGIKNDYLGARASENSLEGTMANSRVSIQDIQRKEFRRKELKQEVDAKTAIYDTFLQRFNETNATDDLNTGNARVVDPAVVPGDPVKPNKKLIILLAFMLSAMAGVGFSLLLAALNNTVQTAEDVENKLASSILGILPLLKITKKNPHPSYHEFLDDVQSSFAESVRTIRTGVVLSGLDNPHKIIAVTSTVPGEGKTSVALNMAFGLAQMEKVLLIGADMRRPSLAKALGLDASAPGLSNLVAGTSSLEDCIQHHASSNIDVITAGLIPPNPLELLSSNRFATVLETLGAKYDRILIDTAPTQAVSDALVLAPKVGAMIYVVKADSTSYLQAKAGLKRLREINAPLIGVVLNQVNTRKVSKYYGGDYGGYYDNYGYTAASQNAA
uniref:GumC family protein n=1 Tax=Marinobacterium profundum TaxID=1714300 RepID=UPI001FDEAA30|nr:polysaccharide biosynthesis tyrosine autokinase [Marinobacterium profundum]